MNLEERIKAFQEDRDGDYWITQAINDFHKAESKLRELQDIEENTGFGEEIDMSLSGIEVEIIVEHRRTEVEKQLLKREREMALKYAFLKEQ